VNPPSDVDPSDPSTGSALLELQRTAYAVEAQLIGDQRIPNLRESLEELLGARLHWVAIRDQVGIVAAAGYLETSSEMEIDRLMVAPGAFRRGHGGHLVTELVRRAGHRSVRVSTGLANAPAITLYEGFGFAKMGESEPLPGLRTIRLERSCACPSCGPPPSRSG
jgi:ribosomal protein S18 acetylase RimI-like enzyme